MSESVSFPCPNCHAKLRAATRFVRRSSACPSCGKTVVVPPTIPEAAGPVLLWDNESSQPRRRLNASWF